MTKPNPFKRTKYFVANKVEAEALQKAMFKLGFKWLSETAVGVKRVLRNEYFDNGGWVYVDSDCRISCAPGRNEYDDRSEYQSVFQTVLFEAAEAKKLEKKAERRASRRRKAGWTTVDPTTLLASPVPGNDTELEVILRNGQHVTWLNKYFSWGTLADHPWREIVAYRLTAAATKTVTLDEMIQRIVKDAGGTEVQNVDSEGFTVWNGGECPLAKGTLVEVKYRDGKRATLPAGGMPGDGDDVYCKVTGRRAGGAYWRNDSADNDIVAYRVVAATAAPETVYEPLPEEPVQDTNPKRQYGVSSVPLNMWSQLASAYGALALHNGSLKYGKANFANTPVEASIYIAAAYRHLSAWAAGQEFDPADGVPNLGGVLANIAILLEARAAGTLIDDRLRMDGYLKEIDKLKEIAKSLNELHAGKNPKHYTLGDA